MLSKPQHMMNLTTTSAPLARQNHMKTYNIYGSENLQLIAQFIEVINDEEFCVGCFLRGIPITSLHKLNACPHGIAGYKDQSWLSWRKQLIFPNAVGVCGGCGVSKEVHLLILTYHFFNLTYDLQSIYSDENNEDTKLLHLESMGPSSCPHLDGMRVFAWLVVTNPEFEAQFCTSRWAPTRPIGGIRTWQSWLARQDPIHMSSNLYNIALWWIQVYGMPAIPS